MLRIDRVTAGYGAGAVLSELSLAVEEGQRIAVLGRNGVGKTTLLRVIIGGLPVQDGTVNLEDRDITREPPHRRARAGIAYVPQGRDIFPGLSVLDNLKVAAYATRQRGWLPLLDEPSEGIQPSIVAQIAEHVRAMNEQRGITVVLVEQNLEFAAALAEHAYLMDKGRIVRELPARDILADRDLQHEYLGV
jgi:branched-chain amino acid transport system ATP-binding protein/urea transport system ATP-binding protein